MTEGDWKRRERTLGYAVMVWALAVAGLATLSPAAVATWLTTTPALTVAGVIMLSIGLLGAVFRAGAALLDRWVAADHPDTLLNGGDA